MKKCLYLFVCLFSINLASAQDLGPQVDDFSENIILVAGTATDININPSQDNGFPVFKLTGDPDYFFQDYDSAYNSGISQGVDASTSDIRPFLEKTIVTSVDNGSGPVIKIESWKEFLAANSSVTEDKYDNIIFFGPENLKQFFIENIYDVTNNQLSDQELEALIQPTIANYNDLLNLNASGVDNYLVRFIIQNTKAILNI